MQPASALPLDRFRDHLAVPLAAIVFAAVAYGVVAPRRIENAQPRPDSRRIEVTAETSEPRSGVRQIAITREATLQPASLPAAAPIDASPAAEERRTVATREPDGANAKATPPVPPQRPLVSRKMGEVKRVAQTVKADRASSKPGAQPAQAAANSGLFDKTFALGAGVVSWTVDGVAYAGTKAGQVGRSAIGLVGDLIPMRGD